MDISGNQLSGNIPAITKRYSILQQLKVIIQTSSFIVLVCALGLYGLGGKASTSGDVYSFGILLLEMIIAKKRTDGIFQEGLSINKFISKVHESSGWEISGVEVAGGEGYACWKLVSAETSGTEGKGEGFSTVFMSISKLGRKTKKLSGHRQRPPA
ncbi:putative leucine-rich repeat receptor-like serine/threonine-protein kinase [Quercus suber]|uniref:Leucine-rich repeat receptor-like serine/threonine-protein kinase n=1 Tax=Quercus suber TaxID=58331 RepID=A0AAW0JF18_QUESU